MSKGMWVGVVATAVLVLAAVVAVLVGSTSDSMRVTDLNNGCLYYQYDDNRMFGDDTSVEGVYCRSAR